MMLLEAARQRATEANVLALAAEKACDAAAEAEVAALQRVLEPKRVRTEQAEQDDDGPSQSCDDWELADHRRETTRVTNRRSVKLVSESMRMLRTGKDGFLQHPRLGLIGTVSYWACCLWRRGVQERRRLPRPLSTLASLAVLARVLVCRLWRV